MPRHRNVVATSNVFLLAGGMAYAMPPPHLRLLPAHPRLPPKGGPPDAYPATGIVALRGIAGTEPPELCKCTLLTISV